MTLHPGKQPHIIIVDDVQATRESLGALLSIDRYQLSFASNGIELLENLAELDPDVILLDVMMPGLDGLEVCRRIRASERWQHLPIILVTALDSRQDLVAGLDAGADDFLHKPVNGVELRARVRSMLRIKHQFDELQAVLELREDLTHMIAHDMRTPITAIIGFSELLLAGLISPRDTADLQSLHRQARQLNALVNDILVQAKMENGKLQLNRAETSLNQLAQQAADDLSQLSTSHRVPVVLHLPDNPPPVSIDHDLFRRVLDNLLSNAIKFSMPDSSVNLQVEYPPNCSLRVQVIDNGPGIPPELHHRIFDKYEVVAIKNRTDAPIGLGLAFCKLVVSAHEGRIFVSNNQPTGAIFTIEI